MKHVAALSFALLAVWLLWSGYFQNALLVVLGALSCIFVVILALRMKLVDAEGVPVEIAWRLLRYAPWLVWQVFLANLHVARCILDRKLPIHPLARLMRPERTMCSNVSKVTNRPDWSRIRSSSATISSCVDP